MRNQQRILGIKWNEFITNDEVAQCTGLQDIRDVATLRRIQLFGHVARLSLTVPASLLLSVSSAARDGYTFQDHTGAGLAADLASLGSTRSAQTPDLSAPDACLLAQDRPSWRAVATA